MLIPSKSTHNALLLLYPPNFNYFKPMESSSCCPTSCGYGACVLPSRGYINKIFRIGHCILVKFGYYVYNYLANYERGNHSFTHNYIREQISEFSCASIHVCRCAVMYRSQRSTSALFPQALSTSSRLILLRQGLLPVWYYII